MASDFERTDIPNLDRNIKYGTYYGRVKLHGKLIRESFGENKRVAMEKLTPWLVSKRGHKRVRKGTLTSMTERYLTWLAGRETTGDLNEETTKYKREQMKAIRAAWPAFNTTAISKLTPHDFEKFRVDFRSKYSAPRTNGAITVIREILHLARKDGFISAGQLEEVTEEFSYTEVDYDYKRMTLDLPSPDELVKIRSAVHHRCLMRGSRGDWLFDFMLFSGSRIEAAGEVRWEDIDWAKDELYFRNAKYGNYTIPLFPELRKLLEDIRKACPNAKYGDRVLPTRSLHSVLASVSRELRLGKPKLTHHDLRHIFATRAIESGKDVVVVAGWLGHRDNGRTVIMVYGHLRKHHSHAAAKEMKFLPEVTAPTEAVKP